MNCYSNFDSFFSLRTKLVSETDQLLIFFLFFLQGNVLQVWKVFTTLSASSRARARRAKILEIEDWEAGFSFSSYRIMKQTFLRRTVASKTSCSSLGTVFKIENKLPAKISTFLSTVCAWFFQPKPKSPWDFSLLYCRCI